MTSSTPSSRRLTSAEIAEQLEGILFPGRSAERMVAGLARLPRHQQELALRWAEVAAHSSAQISYQIVALAPKALARFSEIEARRWVLAALDEYDRGGAAAAIECLRDLDRFHRDREARDAAATFDEVERRLSLLIQGLSGRALRLEAAEAAYTDTATIYLPAQLTDFARRESNRALYKATAVLLWAQTRFGTFAADLEAALAVYRDREQALRWFAVLEAIRLEACLARQLPGLAAELEQIRGEFPAPLRALRDRLAGTQAGVRDSLALLPEVIASGPAPRIPYSGVMRPEAAARARALRLERDKAVLQRALSEIAWNDSESGAPPPRIGVEVDRETLAVAFQMNGEAIPLPAEALAAARSLIQDLDEIPAEFLAPAGPGEWRPRDMPPSAEEADEGGLDAPFRYDEWDYRRGAYRKAWCSLFERDLEPWGTEFVDSVRQRYASLIGQVRRRFEAIRGEDRMHKRQSDGEEIDLDALVEAHGDRRGGVEPDVRLFRRRVRSERSLAVMFMVDMSGSTKGWVNDAEREALVILCEALDVLGDRYAIWGFSGWTRKRCEVYRIKRFNDKYDDRVKGRIAAVEAKDYTRMGPAIRHLTKLLTGEPARHRLLITLSDGKPEDSSDEYRGQYGIEDTRAALLEARQAGIRAFCITIDRHGADYLPHMYGPARFVVIDDVRKLPRKVTEVYRRLTA